MNGGKLFHTLAVILVLALTGASFDEMGPKTQNVIESGTVHSQDLAVGEVPLSRPADLGRLIDRGITIIDTGESFARALVTPGELEWLREAGVEHQIIFEDLAEMWGWRDDPGTLRDFHSYQEMADELQQIAIDYPEITRLYDLGHSVQGRAIWGLKITANPEQEEDEPEVRILGLHHGDELMSAEVPLLLSWCLVENYGINPFITDLVDGREIWIIPMVNPDGREADPYPNRWNANGVDLNRDYGYMWDGWGNSPAPFSQLETRTIRENALDNNFVLSLSFHCSGDIVNYLWNYTPHNTPDDDLIVQLSEEYASYNGYWVVEGYNWYQVRGDTDDFSYGCRGDIDWTIEIQNSDIPQAWDLNRDAILQIIDAAGRQGIAGKVTDASTGDPLAATVWVEEAYWPCFTDPKVGDYHRLLQPGTYTVHYRANGYEEQVHTVEVTSSEEPVVLDVALVPGENRYAYQVTWCNFYDPYGYPDNFQNNPSNATAALGPPDGTQASLGVGGEITIDMGVYGRIANEDGSDFTVFENDATSEGYEVSVSNTWDGPWTQLGDGLGTTSFDLETVSLETARYIRIMDDGDGSVWETFPGFDLDAVQSLHPPLTTLHVDNDDPEFIVFSGNWNTVNHQNAYNGNTRYIRAGTGDNRAGWRVDSIVVPGTYDVYAWKFEHEFMDLMATNVHYQVRYRNGMSDWILVDQSNPGNEWVYLGRFEFDNDSIQGILITDEADGFVIADAIQLVRTGPKR